MTRRPETWGETFNRYLRKGHDHGSAAYMADQNEARKSSSLRGPDGAATRHTLSAPDTPNQGQTNDQ